MAILNRRVDGTPTKVSAMLTKLGLDFSKGYHIRELFEQEDYGVLLPDQTLQVRVNPSGNCSSKRSLQLSTRIIVLGF